MKYSNRRKNKSTLVIMTFYFLNVVIHQCQKTQLKITKNNKTSTKLEKGQIEKITIFFAAR